MNKIFNKILISISIIMPMALASCGNKKNEESSSSFDSSLISETTSLTTSEVTSEEESTSAEDTSEESSSTSQETSHVTAYNNYYYDLVSWTDGEDLKQQLHDIIHDGYTPLKYDGNYESNKDADKSYNDFEYLDVIYSNNDVFHSKTNIGWQREHAWPASLMTGQSTTTAVKTLGRATDFHNLWAANSSGNSSRGNKNYGIADTSNPDYKDFGGYTYDPQTFEPSNEDKGLVARSIFYMATMYKDDVVNEEGQTIYQGLNITEEVVTYDSSDSNTFYKIGNLSTLVEWNNIPVNLHEAQHNESVYSYALGGTNTAQGNRNPYIDFPELVDYVYGDKKNESGSLISLTPTCESVEFKEHYALAFAKRDYKLGETLTSSDYQVVKVNTDLTVEEVEATNSLDGHTFTSEDGDVVTAALTIDSFNYSYEISLNPMGNCSYVGQMDKNWTSADKNGTDDSGNHVDTTDGEVTWRFYYEATSGITSRQIIADNKNGGFKMGSGTFAVTKVIITTIDEYTVDAAYIKAFASNTSSSFNLKIMVGENTLLDSATVIYNNQTPAIYGKTIDAPLTGQISFILTGSNAINLQCIAFNKVIA